MHSGQSRAALLFVLVPFALAGGAAACGKSHAAGFEDDGGTGAGGDGGDPGAFTQGDGAAGCNAKCSADLRSVVDCNDQVLRTCPPDQGCGAGGQCVAPCASASDNKSSIGCDYFVMNPDGWSPIPGNAGTSAGSCFAMFVANTWPSPAQLTVDYRGQSLDAAKFAYLPKGSGAGLTYVPLPNGQLPPNEIAVVFLAQFGATAQDKALCPSGVNVALSQDPAVHGTGLGNAFHVTSSVPVVAYDMYPYGGAASYISSATLLLPTTVWGTNYVAVGAFEGSSILGMPRPMNVSLVAAEDGTVVTISGKAAIEGGNGVAAAAAGVPSQIPLSRGQVVQLSQVADLTGSPIQSNKPVALYGGHYCMVIGGAAACDAAHQQIPPIVALGHEYTAVRYRNRGPDEETVPWRVVGMVDGTVLTYEPAPPPGAPNTLTVGRLVTFDAPGPFIVRSQDDKHPFFFAGHMTGGDTVTDKTSCSSPPCALSIGDPEFVGAVPPEQFLSSYVFLTDPTYGETNLVVVRTKGKAGAFADVTLDCAGPLSGWQPLGAYEYTRVDVQHLGKKAGNCDNGRHTMTSGNPFGITVWGWDTYVSYAYPAGARVTPINTVVVPPGPK